MTTMWRRFELLLPRRLNDGREVPPQIHGQAAIELISRFGAASTETQIIEGAWSHSGAVFRDELARLFVDVPDTDQNRAWMREFKERWRIRLEQIDLWMVSYPIEVE